MDKIVDLEIKKNWGIMDNSNLFENLKDSIILPFLKKYDYTKKGSLYLKKIENTGYNVIELRSHKYNTSTFSFTIDYGIYINDFATIIHGKKPKVIKIEDCTMSKGFSQAFDLKKEKWFEITGENSIKNTAEELKQKLPVFLEKYSVANNLDMVNALTTSKNEYIPNIVAGIILIKELNSLTQGEELIQNYYPRLNEYWWNKFSKFDPELFSSFPKKLK